MEPASVFVHLRCLNHDNAVIYRQAHRQINHNKHVSTRQSKGLGSNNQACLSNLLKFTLLRTHRKSPHISSSATVSIRATTAGRMHICTATVTGKPLNDYPLTHQPPPPYTNTTQPVCCIPTVSQLASVRGGGGGQATFATFS